MQEWKRPPGRTSMRANRMVQPCGANQAVRYLGSVQASNTSLRGASKMRSMTMLPASLAASGSGLLADISVCLWFASLHCAQQLVELIERFIPEPPIVIHPRVRFLERGRPQLAVLLSAEALLAYQL